jgi:oxygen-independent coproporphyrinogen-3 oxidase
LEDRRYRNVPDVDRYIDLIDACGLAEAESETISPSMLVTEMILMQLRLIEGMAIAAFRKRTGHDAIELFGETLERLAEMGLLTVSDTHIALTRRGRLLSDSVMAELAAATE